MTARPQRNFRARHFPDRLLGEPLAKTEMEIGYALAPFDAAAREAERRWGIDRLPEMVAPETAQRYGAAMAFLNEAIAAADPAKVAAAAQNCIRGMEALDAEARRMGHKPAPAEVMIYREGNSQFGVVVDNRDWPTLAETHPGLTLYTLREIALMIESQPGAVAATKAEFPGSEIREIRKTIQHEEMLDDEIPF